MASSPPRNAVLQSGFQYQAVSSGHIRLIRFIKHEPDTDSLELSLTDDLDLDHQDRNYLALSYCWGDPSDTKQILVDDQPFHITVNLYSALRDIHAYGDTTSCFWADAICIDQQNIVERNAQVAQMWRVYSQAELICAWVGAKDSLTWPAIQIMHALRMFYITNESSYLRTAETLLPKTQDGEDVSRYDAAFSIVFREYFQRTWILTELLQTSSEFSVNFFVGEDKFLFDELELLARIVFHHNSGLTNADNTSQGIERSLEATESVDGSIKPYSKYKIPNVIVARREYMDSVKLKRGGFMLWASWENSPWGGNKYRTFVSGLGCFLGGLCADPRDRVYAMLGHPAARELDPEMLFRPDYTLTADEVFVVTLEWLGRVFDLEAYGERSKLYTSKMFRDGLCQALLDGQNLVYDDFEKWIRLHEDWNTEKFPGTLILSSGKAVDCSGPIMSLLLAPTQDEDEPHVITGFADSMNQPAFGSLLDEYHAAADPEGDS